MKYLDSLQDDLAQQVEIRKGSKKVHIETPHFEFNVTTQGLPKNNLLKFVSFVHSYIREIRDKIGIIDHE